MTLIRPATADEAGAIARAHAEAHWETYAPLLGAAAQRLEVGPLELAWRRAFRDKALIRVAEAAGEIAGVGCIAGTTLEWLYLRAAHRGAGLGSRMLAELLAEARERDIAVVTFGVHSANTAAARFYEREGARLVGRQLIRHPDGDWEDLVFEISTTPA
jgi:ribosomal protein S18 acetylase RimI-like enzyme